MATVTGSSGPKSHRMWSAKMLEMSWNTNMNERSVLKKPSPPPKKKTQHNTSKCSKLSHPSAKIQKNLPSQQIISSRPPQLSTCFIKVEPASIKVEPPFQTKNTAATGARVPPGRSAQLDENGPTASSVPPASLREAVGSCPYSHPTKWTLTNAGFHVQASEEREAGRGWFF